MGIFKWIWLSFCILPCSAHIYSNQWGVLIEGGHKAADEVAEEHGFVNHGQIGALADHYTFSHKSVAEQSEELAHHHHQKLATHPKVLWAEQQKSRKRVKRDLVELKEPAVATKWNPHFKDPLWDKQWYLHDGGHGGYDMNVRGAWARGYSGRGVVITILDDGIERTHSDLKQNYDPEASLDINGGDDDPMPRYDSTDENRHGTRCAGEVSAKANNTVCGVGVAYNAKIGGVRMLDGDVNDIVEAKALSHNPDHVDIYSASWGPDDDGRVVDGPATLAKKAFIQGVLQGRGGKGSIFVWASGNGGSSHDSCSCDGYTNSIFTLSVSSTSEHGTTPWYLEQCASTLTTTYSSGANYEERKIITTDLRDRCTELHTGTSASAPLAAGLVALALEANSDLTWRDMQHIIVHTSRPDAMVDGEWIINGMGRRVSHKYGYGLMDAEGMVRLAERWTNVPEQNLCISDVMKVDQPIEGKGSYVKVVTDGCDGTSNKVRYTEHVQAKVTLSVARRGDLQIHLVSPNGTRSTLLPQRKRDYSAFGFEEWPFTSVFYWGESPKGTWKLELENLGGGSNVGVLTSWQLILYGTASQPVHLRDPPAPGSGDIDEDDNTHNEVEIIPGVDEEEGGKQKEETEGGSGIKVEVSEGEGMTCSSLCMEGSGCSGPLPADCDACAAVRLGDTGPCMEQCPARTFRGPGAICRHCLLSCDSCTGTTTCTRCVAGYFLQHDHTCAATCLHGYTPERERGVCVACVRPCASCSGSPEQCLSCQAGFTLSGTQCLVECTTQQYRDAAGRCEDCPVQCLTCLGSHQCVTCPPDLFYLNATCVDQCPTGFYTDSNVNGTCTRCHPSCAECTGAGAEDCVSCHLPLKLSHSQCVEECPDGSYSTEEGACVPCHESCATCRGPQPTHCLSCHIPMYHSTIDRSCIAECEAGTYGHAAADDALVCSPCHRDCSTCSGGDTHRHCNTCAQHLLMSPTVGCVTHCPLGEYMSGSVCLACPELCSACSSGDVCTACHQHHSGVTALLYEHSCLTHCPHGWYAHVTQDREGGGGEGRCLPCHVSCAACSAAGEMSCTGCREGFSMQADGVCVEDATPFQANCPDGQVFLPHTENCVPCHESCVRCFSAGALGCETCVAGLQLYEERHQCVACCSPTVTHTCCICNATGVCLQSHFIIADGSPPRPPSSTQHTPTSPDDTPAAGEGTGEGVEQSTPSFSETPPTASPLTGVVVAALVLCAVLALLVFFGVYGVIQARQNERLCWKVRYKPVPTQNNRAGGNININGATLNCGEKCSSKFRDDDHSMDEEEEEEEAEDSYSP